MEVFCDAYRFQMFGIDTSPNTAKVIKVKTIRNGADKLFVEHAVCLINLPAPSDLPVPCCGF
jgi:hypothetical protein